MVPMVIALHKCILRLHATCELASRIRNVSHFSTFLSDALMPPVAQRGGIDCDVLDFNSVVYFKFLTGYRRCAIATSSGS